MNREYVVVRGGASRHEEGTRGGPVLASPLDSDGLEDAIVESARLTAAERVEAVRDPSVRAVAASMPMKLIAPVDSEEGDDVVPTWGIEAVGADRSPFDGSGVVVAVLDTGIDAEHPAFGAVELEVKNFTSEPAADLDGHGTHCAGTIFGGDVDGTRIGIARNVERALIGKVLGEGGGSSLSIAEALQWAAGEGAHIISMSLGIDFPGFVDKLVTDFDMPVNAATSLALTEYRQNVDLFGVVAEMMRAQSAFGRGAMIVAASGNESNRPDYTIAVSPPAVSERIISVGALGRSADGFLVASFSNTEVDVSGPGVGIVSARPGGGLVGLSGTSMATPHVAGVAALRAQKMKEATGAINPSALSAQVIGTADLGPLSPVSTSDDVGSGIVQAPMV